MPSINLRQLRNTHQLKNWLQAGKVVELRERNRVLGRIVPEGPPAEPQAWPDFATRTKNVFGKRKLPGADLLIKERGRY
jgi:hypothetical protein